MKIMTQRRVRSARRLCHLCGVVSQTSYISSRYLVTLNLFNLGNFT